MGMTNLASTILPLFEEELKGVCFYEPTLSVWIAPGIVLILLLCSGFVSASEIAFFSLKPSDRLAIDEEKHPRDGRVASLLGDSERLLATILISNNLVNVAVIIILYFCFDKTIEFGQAEPYHYYVVTMPGFEEPEDYESFREYEMVPEEVREAYIRRQLAKEDAE